MYDTTKPYKTQILEAVKRTWKSPYISAAGDFPIFRLNSQWMYQVDHTDGIGTKGVIHWQDRTFHSAVQDALAMNINDLLVARAIPYKLQNHLTLPVDDHQAIVEIINILANECIKLNIVITGGETSIHNTSCGMDLSITMSGFTDKVYTNKFNPGDYVYGLPSSGFHSNGFTKLRELSIKIPTAPTVIYNIPPEIIKNISCIVHIAGGGWTRLKSCLDGCSLHIDHQYTLPCFKEVYNRPYPFNKIFPIADIEMYKTFNCGIGMFLGINPEKVNLVKEFLDMSNAVFCGIVERGCCELTIKSVFSGQAPLLI